MNFSQMPVRQSLLLVTGLLMACLLVCGFTGLHSLTAMQTSLQSVYEDRLIAMAQLDQVIRSEERVQALLARISQRGADDSASEIVAIGQLQQHADRYWQDYMATYLTEDEQKLAREFAVTSAVSAERGKSAVTAAAGRQRARGVAGISHPSV